MRIKLLDYDYYGLKVFDIDGKEYAFAESEVQAINACTECIEESYWAFIPDFIARYLTIKLNNAEKHIKLIQENLYEDCNELIKAIVDKDDFVADAIREDGVSHFLASYDGEEISLNELDDAEEIESYIKNNIELEEDYQPIDWLFYRIN